MVADDFAAHDFVELVLQAFDLAGQFFKAAERNHADLAVFEGNGIAGVALRADAVETKDFAGHLEAGHLVAAVLQDDVGFEGAGADRVDRLEAVARAVEMLLALDLAAGTDELVELVDLPGVKAERQAQLAQVALGAGRLGLCCHYRNYRFHLHGQSPELRGFINLWSPLIHINTIQG